VQLAHIDFLFFYRGNVPERTLTIALCGIKVDGPRRSKRA